MGRNYKDKAETELAALMVTGDKKAFEEIHSRFFPLLYRHAVGMLKDHPLAEDALQDVFCTMWEKRTSISINTSLKGYFYTATRNAVLRKMDRRKSADEYLSSLANSSERLESSAEHDLIEKELWDIFEDEIERLPVKMRAVFKLSITGEYTNRELSANLNIAEQTVKNQVQNALKILRPRISHLLKSLF